MLSQSLSRAVALARSVYDDFREFLSPSSCLCCGRARDFPDPLLCPVCLDALRRKNIGDGPICPFCGRPFGAGSPCEFCVSTRHLRLYFWGLYDGELKECLLQFKFHGAIELGRQLTEMAVGSLQERLTGNTYDYLIAVPLHKNRERERRFNQSDVLAQGLAPLLGTQFLVGALIRTKITGQQAKLEESRRWSMSRTLFPLAWRPRR
jgi:predicted amidophosphoribosyltransferase